MSVHTEWESDYTNLAPDQQLVKTVFEAFMFRKTCTCKMGSDQRIKLLLKHLLNGMLNKEQRPFDELFAQHDLRSLHLDQFLVVVVDDGLFQLLLLLFCHGNWVRRWGVGLIVQRAELVGPHVPNGSTCSAL